MAKQKKKINQNVLIFIITVVVFVTVFFVVQIVRFFERPVDTVLVRKGELINYEEVTGYIIRNEELIDLSSYEGIRKSEVDDATRVSKGAPIIKYVSNSESQLIEKINKLDEKIDVAKENQKTIYSNDVKLLDIEIESSIYNQVKDCIRIDEITEIKNNLNNKINKKAKIVGELSPAGSELKLLMEERRNYEKQLNDSEKSLISPKAGLVSYRVDGFENVLTYDSISVLTSKKLSSLKIPLNKVIPLDSKKVKLVDNFSCYIVIPMKSEEAINAKLNENVYLRFSNSNSNDSLVAATIDYISEEDDEVLLVFKINSNVEELTKFRKIGLDVVWWRATGLKVNEEALFDTEIEIERVIEKTISEEIESGDIINESGDNTYIKKEKISVPTITIKKAYSEENVFVKVLKRANGFVIIDNYKDSELVEMGISEEILENRKILKMFDEAIVYKDEIS